MKNNYINIFLISGSGLLGGLVNYIYHPIMLQYLTIEEFGEFGSLVGLFAILGVFTSGVHLFITKEVSRNIENKSKVKGILTLAMKYLTLIGGVLFLSYLLLSPLIADYLSIHLLSVMIIGIVILTSFIGVSMSAILTGLRRFEFIAFNAVFHPLMKLLIGVGGVALGYGMGGALGGFIMSGILSLGVTALYLRSVFSGVHSTDEREGILEDLKGSQGSLIQFILVSVSFSILMNADVIIARNIFSPDLAGAYAGVSIVGKFLLFVLLSIETVYYGQIIEHGKRHIPLHLVRNALLVMVILSFAAICVNSLFGGYILSLLSPGLDSYTSVYLLLIGYYGLLAFISIFSKILVAWGVYSVNILLAILTLVFLLGAYMYGSGSLLDFASVLLVTMSGGVVIIGSLFVRHLFYHKH